MRLFIYLSLMCLIFVVRHAPAQAVPAKPSVGEISSLPAVVVQVPTAIPAFIGMTSTGPEGSSGFQKVGSLADYEKMFGKDAGAKAYLYASMQLFYANGGGDAYVYSVGTKPADVSRAAFLRALEVLSKEKAPALILFPDAVNLKPDDLGAVQRAALAQCALLKNRFCILDVPGADALSKVDEPNRGFRAKIGTDNLEWGAAYGPWLKVTSALDSTNRPSQIPASGAIAGVYASVDSKRGVWKAPANVALTGVVGLSEAIDDRAQESLNAATSGKSINAIRSFPGRGIMVWGSRTLAGNDNEWRHVPVRRLFIMVEESIGRSTASAMYEPNVATTWLKVRAMIENYLADLWRQGALAGSKPDQAYFVKVGLGSTMTAQDIAENRLIIVVGMAATRPSEFVVMRFQVQIQRS